MLNKTLFFAAGEISGDMHAADLIVKLKELAPSLRCVGIGGKKMAEAGLEAITGDISIYGTMGITDSLRFSKENVNAYQLSIQYLKNNPVDAVILVDNQGLNIGRAKAAKKLGLKVIYYFPPHVSIWGAWDAPKLVKTTDFLLVPFYQDYLVYQKHTDKVLFTGNPLLDKTSDYQLPKDFYQKHRLDRNKKIVSIMPGSRFQEVDSLLPPMLSAARTLKEKHGLQIVLPIAHPIYEDQIRAKVKEAGLDKDISIVVGDSYGVMSVSDVNIMSSGTATLESALFGKPTVICYIISGLTYFIAKTFLVKKQLVGLPNIILEKKVFPELLQKECNPQRMVEEALRFLNLNEDEKKEYSDYYQKIKQNVGEKGVVGRAAAKILELL